MHSAFFFFFFRSSDSDYVHGEGVEHDQVEAVKWYRMAAEQGDATAQNNLGDAYHLGKGVEQDQVEAVRWFRMAAEQFHAAAKMQLLTLGEDAEGMINFKAAAVRSCRSYHSPILNVDKAQCLLIFFLDYFDCRQDMRLALFSLYIAPQQVLQIGERNRSHLGDILRSGAKPKQKSKSPM